MRKLPPKYQEMLKKLTCLERKMALILLKVNGVDATVEFINESVREDKNE